MVVIASWKHVRLLAEAEIPKTDVNDRSDHDSLNQRDEGLSFSRIMILVSFEESLMTLGLGIFDAQFRPGEVENGAAVFVNAADAAGKQGVSISGQLGGSGDRSDDEVEEVVFFGLLGWGQFLFGQEANDVLVGLWGGGCGYESD
jgi:hypothetical protein